MTRRNERVRQAHDWLRKAWSDFQAAELLMQQSKLYEIAAYHCQQSVEKALKGYLTWREQPFRKTHDLLELIDQCIESDSLFATFRTFARDVSPYAIVARYPDIDDVVEEEEIQAAVRQTRALLEFVRARIPSESAS